MMISADTRSAGDGSAGGGCFWNTRPRPKFGGPAKKVSSRAPA
jgi:hypothetical protein